MTSTNVKSSEKNQHNVDGTILAEYTIHKRIGKGAYGIVYKAFDKSNKQYVAIKKIFDAFRNKTDAQRTYREILFLKSFQRHPNIITMLDIYKAVNNRDLYVVFEYMENDLNKVIKDKILKDVHIRFIMFQLSNGLSYIHGCKVMHRDLKPSNILIDKSCSIKIGDLGLARSVSDSEDCLTEYIATRWYRAPEILISNRKYTQHVDIWSLGCILAEMLQSKPLFPGASTSHQLQMIINLVRKSPPHADKFYVGFKNKSEEAIDLLHQLLVLCPTQRFNSEDILQHPYISKYFPSEIHTIPDIAPHTILLDINDNNQLEIDEYQDKLYDIVKRSKKKKAIKRLNKTIQDDGHLPKDTAYSKLKSREKENCNKHSFQRNVKTTSGNVKSEDHQYLSATNHDYDVASTSDYESNGIIKKNYIAYNKQNVVNYTNLKRKDTKQQTHPAVANISNGVTPVLVTSKSYHIDKNHVKHASKTWLDASSYEMKKADKNDRKSISYDVNKCNNAGNTAYHSNLNHKVASKRSEIKITGSKNLVPAARTCEEIESELIRKHSITNSQQNIDGRTSQDINMKVNQEMIQSTFDKNWDELLSKPFSHSELRGNNGKSKYFQDDEVSICDGVDVKLDNSEKCTGFKKSFTAPFVAQVNAPNRSSNTYWVESKTNKKCSKDTGTGTSYLLGDKGKLLYQGDSHVKNNIPGVERAEVSMGRKVERKINRNNRIVNKTESKHKFVKTHDEGIEIVENYPLSNEPDYLGLRKPFDPCSLSSIQCYPHTISSDKHDNIEDRSSKSKYSTTHVPSVQKLIGTMQSVHDKQERRWSDHALKYTERNGVCNGDNHTVGEQSPYSYHNSYTGDTSAHTKQFMNKNCFFDKILNYYNPNTNNKDNSTCNYLSTQSNQTQKQPSCNNILSTSMVSNGCNPKNKHSETDGCNEGTNIFQCFKKSKSKVKTYFDYNKLFNEKLNNMHRLSVLNFNIAPIGMDDSDMNDDISGIEMNNNQEVNGNPVRLLKPDLNEYATSDVSVSEEPFCRYCNW